MNLNEACRNIGVEAWMFDLDDTLIPTNWVFIQQMRVYAQFLSQRLGGDSSEKIWESLTRNNNQTYREKAVNPKRWKMVVERMAREFGRSGEEFLAGLDILNQIYHIRLSFHEGVEEILAGLSQARVPMGIVTHANGEWTARKLEWLGMERYITREQVWIVSEDKHKGPEDWREAVASRGFDPARTGIVGDSLPGDIMAAHQIGVRRKFYVPSPWSVYNSGEIPPGTVVLDKISGLIPAVLNLVSHGRSGEDDVG